MPGSLGCATTAYWGPRFFAGTIWAHLWRISDFKIINKVYVGNNDWHNL